MPRLLGAAGVAPAPAATATESALLHLGRLSGAWGVARAALPELEGIGEVSAPGATIARVRQAIDGLPVEDGELRVLVGPGGEMVATNGTLVSVATPRDPVDYSIDEAQAVARAVALRYQRDFDPAVLAAPGLHAGAPRVMRGRSGELEVQLARAQQAWHHTGATLIRAWIVEAYAGEAGSTIGDAFRTVLTADGAQVLSHRSLVSDAAFSYRVFADPSGEQRPLDGPIADYSPHPTGTPTGMFPAYVGSTMVTVDGLNHPAGAAMPDPWLGAAASETVGNNVDAYSDVNPPSGLSDGDFRASATSAGAFDRAYDLNASPLLSRDQQMAGITSAFYAINWLHDFWYDAGFTEAAGNAQTDNYGRGGMGGDAMLAETQDNAPVSLNNANMSVPSDGLPPRMQIFVWSGKEDRTLTIQPANRTPMTGVARFGPISFDRTGPIALAVDGTDPVNDGCTALTGDYTGKIVLVDRGLCSYRLKALNVQQAGGIAMLLANTVAGEAPPTLGNDAMVMGEITIGVLSVTYEEGVQLKAELAAGGATAVAHRAVPLFDGSLDATLVAHEFGHYLHHRLQSCNTKFCSALSEGWGDFLALLLMIREGDNLDGAYPFSIYTTQGFNSDPAYYGIRRAPFSVNRAINALSYRHMADGEALPTSHPFLTFNLNSEVHNAGEVWAQVMMEVYVALLKAGTSFTAVRAKMARYVVAGLMMAPRDSTPTEMRDALLAVASAEDRPIILAAFTRRGMGSCAITPSRDSRTFKGIVESAEIKGRAAVGSIAVEAAKACDDDDVLDAGETAVVSLPVVNAGHLPLSGVRITVTSANPEIAVLSEPVAIASLLAGASQDLSFEIKLDERAEGAIAGEFTIQVEAADGCASVFEARFPLRLNVNDDPEASAVDTFDADSIWVPGEGSLWRQAYESGLDRSWHGDDARTRSDSTLDSPAVKVGSDPFRVTFAHRYQFEHDGTAWDGGVIEFSLDDGVSWADVSSLTGVNPGYTHTLASNTPNPLGGRMAYANQNAAYPETNTVTLDFGTLFAGKTVKLRFRLGTDGAVGGEGWDIDDVAFQGIKGKPFPAQIADRVCGPDDEGGGCCDAGPLRGGPVALTAGVLALLLRRRRRVR